MKKGTILLLLWLLMAGSSVAQIKDVKVITETPQLYDKVDLDVQLKSRWKNPYLQEEVKLDMHVTTPSGKTLVLPCFYHSGESGRESLWKARFAPQETGQYSAAFVLVRAGKNKTTSKPVSFDVHPSDKPGFLHIRNNWTLQFDNGKPFRGVGMNICWESRDNDDSKYFKDLHELASVYNYDYMLADLARNGGNFFRTWICSWNLPIDYKAPFNNSRYTASDEFYNPSAVKRLDEVVQMSDSLGLYMMLTLGTGGFRDKDGGAVKTTDEFFASPIAKESYKNRLRYIVARWGYSPAIAMWEFFNEVDNVQHNNRETPINGNDIVQWHDEMSTYLKQIDPYGHIVTTSISHRDIDGLNSLPAIDINQKHIYNNTSVIPSEIKKYTNQFNKPYIIGEFGYEWNWAKNFNEFADGMDTDFRRGLWYGIFSPTPVTPMSWWWEFFDNRWMTPYFRGVRMINDRMLAAGNGEYEPVAVKAGNAEAFGVKCGNEVYVYLYNPADSVLISDLSIEGANDKTYTVQCFEPSSMIFRDATDKATFGAGQATLNQITLGSEKEILYILTPIKP